MLHVRVEDEVKSQASAALAALGLSVSDAVRILLKRVIKDQAFPLELKTPNAATRAVTCPLPPCHSFGESPGLQGNFVGGLVLS